MQACLFSNNVFLQTIIVFWVRVGGRRNCGDDYVSGVDELAGMYRRMNRKINIITT